MAEKLKQYKYDDNMKAIGLKKCCVWAMESDHYKIKAVAKTSRNKCKREIKAFEVERQNNASAESKQG